MWMASPNMRLSLPVPGLEGPGCPCICGNPGRERSAQVVVTVPSKQGGRMSTIHFHQSTTSTPEQFVAGLTDFGPGRSKVFSNSADGYLKVYQRGLHEADVTEGSGGI